MSSLNRFIILILLVLSAVSAVFFCSPLPQDPRDSSNTSVSLIIKDMNGKISLNSYADTVNKKFFIGSVLKLPEYLDSLKLTIKFSDTVIFDTTFLTASLGISYMDTIWVERTYFAPGLYSATITPYSSLGLQPVSANLLLVEAAIMPENHKPVITVTGNTILKPADTCRLSVATSDADVNQILTAATKGKPAGSELVNKMFTWVIPPSFTGLDTISFIVMDNGYPVQSDTEIVVIIVTSTPHPPLISISGDTIIQTLKPCTLSIATSDEDAGQALLVNMSGNPAGSVIAENSTFIWTPAATDTGKHPILFTVTDNGIPPLNNSVLINLHVKPADTLVSISPVNSAPKWDNKTLSVPLKDTAIYVINLMDICRDNDGDSIVFSLIDGAPAGDTIINMTYKFVATPTLIGEYKVIIIASDPKGAADTLTIDLLVNSSSMVDVTPPKITLVTPPNDSAITGSETYTITVECTDASGITSVVGKTSSATFTGKYVSGVQWDITISGLVKEEWNVVTITATDGSLQENTSSQMLYVNYKPEIVDEIGPVIELVSHTEGQFVSNRNVILKVKATDIGSGVDEVAFNGKPALADGELYSMALELVSGVNTIVVTASDKSSLNNASQLIVHISFDSTLIDSAGPVITVLSPDTLLPVTSADIVLSIKAIDPSGIGFVKINNTTLTSTNNVFNYATVLNEGKNTFTVVAQDASFNKNQATHTFSVKYDPPPSPVSILTAEPTANSVQLSWSMATITDFVNYKVYYSASPNVDSNSTLFNTITSKVNTNCTIGSLSGHTIYYFRVYVSDSTSTTGSAIAHVSTLNSRPSFSAVSPVTVTERKALSVTVQATDPDGDNITYLLPSDLLPVQWHGASLNSTTGVLTWTPGWFDAGTGSFYIVARDNASTPLSDTLRIQVTVTDSNRVPVFTKTESSVKDTAIINEEYRDTITASDPDSDVVTYQILSGPTGMQVNANGIVTFTPAEKGNYPVSLIADDGKGGKDTLTWTISMPTFLKLVSEYKLHENAYIYSMRLFGNYLYVGGLHDGLTCIDISNPVNPEVVSEYPDLKNVYGIEIQGNYLYTAAFDSCFMAFDISSPGSIIRTSQLLLGGNRTVHNIAVSGNFCYEGGSSYINAVDITNPSNPVQIWQLTDSYSYSGTNRMIASESYLYVATQDSGFFVHKTDQMPTTKKTPLVARIDISGLQDMAISGNYAYLAGNTNFLVVDIGSPESPTVVGTLPFSTGLNSVATTGKYVILYQSSKITIVDISSPSNPTLVCTSKPLTCLDVLAKENIVYIGTTNGVNIFRLCNP